MLSNSQKNKNPKYNVFDMMLKTEFDGNCTSDTFSDRLTFCSLISVLM